MSYAEPLSALHDVAVEVRDFYDRYPYPPPVDNLENTGESGRTLTDAVRTIISSGRTGDIRKINRSSSRVAVRRRRPSMRCAGLRPRSPASTAAPRASVAPRR